MQTDLFLLLALLLAGTGCRPDTSPAAIPTPGEPAQAAERPPNIIVISIDTARSDYFECYGYPYRTTPGLNRLSRRGTLFSYVIAQSPWTVPSHWSIFTGKYVSNHGMMTLHHRPDDTLRTIAQIMGSEGYDTAAFTGGGLMNRHWGFDRGFRIFKALPYGFPQTVPAAETYLADHLAHRPDTPFFLFVHGYDVHAPYHARDMDVTVARQVVPDQPIDPAAIPEYAGIYDEPDLGIYLRRYSAGYREVDRLLTRLIQMLQERNLMDNTYVFITSDHGEEFMRHGGFDHASLALYEEGVSVPMIVLGPDIPVNRIVDRPVQCMDLFASVLQKAGIPAPEDMDARPLFSADGDTVFQPVISETLVFRELIPHMAANYLVDNHTQVWAGRVRPRRPELSVAEAIDLEFGAESGNLVETAPGHLESTFDVDTMHFVLCDEPGTACFLIIEAYTRRDLELKQNLIDSITCGYPDRPVTAPDGWTVEAAGTCGFGLPPEYRMERSLACQSIMDGRWKLILDQGSGIAELYDIEADPMEQRDRAMEFPDVVDRLRSALADRTWIGTYDSRSYADKTVDDETMKQLEILGYAYSD